MSIEIWSKTENISAQTDKNSVLLTEVPFHSSGLGSTSEGATTPLCNTDSKSSILGLSNEVLFDFVLGRWLKKLNVLTENQLYSIVWPPV